MKVKKSLIIIVLALLLTMIVTAPGCTPEEEGEKELRIACVLQQAYIDFFVPVRIGAQDAGKEYGIEVTYLGPDVEDVPKTISIIETELAKGVDGLVVQAGDPPQLKPVLDKAREMGVPVINTNNANIYDGYTGFVGLDPQVAGLKLAENLIEVLKGNGPWAEKHNVKFDDLSKVQIAYLINIPGSANLENRIIGMRNYLSENYPEIVDLGKFDSTTKVPSAKEVVDNLITANPDVTVFVCCASTPTVAAGSAVKDRGLTGKVAVVGMDLLPETLMLIDEGVIAFTLGQQQYMQGYMPVKLLAEHLINGAEIPKVWQPEVEVVTMENVKEVEAREAEFMKNK